MLVLWMLCGVAEKVKENPCKSKTLKLQYMASCHLSYVLHACNTCYTYTFQAGQGKARPRHCLILCSSLHHLGFWMFEDTTWQPINSHVRKETNYIFLRASHHDLSAGFLSLICSVGVQVLTMIFLVGIHYLLPTSCDITGDGYYN